MPIKVSVHLALANRSWAEYYLNTAISTFDGITPLAIELAKKRIVLGGNGVAVRSVILSQELRPGTPATTGDSRVVDLTGNGTASGQINFSDILVDVNIKPDFPNTSLEVRFSNTDGTRRANKTFAGIPDDVVTMTPEGPNFEAGNKWGNRFKAFVKFITAPGWAFWGRRLTGGQTALQEVIGLQQQGAAPSYWGVITDATGELFADKTRIQLKGFKHHFGAQRKWQGQFVVDSMLAIVGPPAKRVYFLRNSQLLDPDDVAELGKIQAVEYEAIHIDKVDLIKQVSRKRGVGYNPPRGRSRPRRNLRTF